MTLQNSAPKVTAGSKVYGWGRYKKLPQPLMHNVNIWFSHLSKYGMISQKVSRQNRQND